ncbi:LOW QUALITY PROTEIN: uncharacterized protein LOC113522426 [Galleria mellonella]|uniref:LOW QUALITY PROTEIN: uncharacterized protein LOC113522426 n=1 Tax=Galleria mellonella TaxID=7137 RepID=A0ABM3MQT0_GALME|nr:LOW QUALITY PROTEIN: uncharacterized protein LOC113522426 [Galleria mellonella]
MEDSSVTHMETDVSSTTGDAMDMQEVTGSDGNVEMVVIVEQVNDDTSSNCFNNNDSQTSQEDDNNPNSLSSPRISPAKSQDSQKLIDKSLRQKVIPSTDMHHKTMSCVKLTHSEDIVDSSSKTDIPRSPNKDNQKSLSKEIQGSPSKEFQSSPNKETKKSPSKETQFFLNKETHRSPNKEIQNSSNKDIQNSQIKVTQSSPVKVTHSLSNKAIKEIYSSPIKSIKEVQSSPIKSIKEVQSSPIKSIKEVQSSLNKTIKKKSIKEVQSSPIKSIKEIQSSPIKIIKEIQSSPLKVIKEIQSSPSKAIKEIQISPVIETQSSPNKESKMSPNKETHISPNKDTLNKQIQNSQNTEIVKESQKSPNKISTNESEEHDTPTKLTIQAQVLESIKKTPIKEISSENTKINGKHEEADSSKKEVSARSDNSVPIEIIIEKETSNDSQIDTGSDISEKDHNKSISRELKSLINSAKESKIISECTQLTSKTRKSRSNLDTSNTSLNASVEADKISGARRSSTNSLKSNSSEKSEKTAVKRSMRSQNPEFVNKVKLFLNSVTKGQKFSDEVSDGETEESKSKEQQTNVLTNTTHSNSTTSKRKKVGGIENQEKSNKLRSDAYCWRCHWLVEQPANEKTHVPMQCTVCPRSFHYKCLSWVERSKIDPEKSWVCPECMGVLHAESSETRSVAMKKISLGMLQELLKHALERMMELNGVEPFMQPVDRTTFPDYDKYVVHPMDLTLMKNNIQSGAYGSTEAFLADAQWILHNSIIFNTLQSKLTGGARGLVRSCRAEMGEIEACPECYAGAHARRPTWFTDVCSTPHVLLWAKLKGFPYWPAKGMSVNNAGMVDVRFFGAHDRAWVPAKDCFLYSEKDPNNFRTKRQDILDSMQEAEQHIRNISRKYGKFVYPPFKTQFDPSKLNEQLKLMIPSFEGEVHTPMKEKRPSNSSSPMVKDKSRSNSKSSKSSIREGDNSENDDVLPARKMADGAVIARVDDDFSLDKDKTKETYSSPSRTKVNEASRKRRRSDLEEAVITIMDNKEKRKRLTNDKLDNSIPQEPSSSKDIDMKSSENKTKDKAENSLKTRNSDTSRSLLVNTSGSEKSTPRVAPIKIITTSKGNKHAVKTSTPKDTVMIDKSALQKAKSLKVLKSPSNQKINSKDEKSRREKRRNSRNNKSLTNTSIAAGKTDKNNERQNGKNSDNSHVKDNSISNTSVEGDSNQVGSEKNNKQNGESSKIKEKSYIMFDDDTSLAVLARGGKSSDNQMSFLPTISSVRSLSTTAQISCTTTTSTASNKTIEVTIEPTGTSVFTPTSTDGVRSMKEAVSHLEKLRNNADRPVVGRVGVRAFARMASSPEKQQNSNVEVEIKAEPMDLDDADRHHEKMDLMNAFKLRPVNPATSNLREVRINKVVVTPLNAKKVPAKTTEIRPRAKKTFPAPRKPDEGRSELNGKNSMVYIPIQPPATPGPAPRPPRPAVIPAHSVSQIRAKAPVITTIVSSSTSVASALGTANQASSLMSIGAAGPGVPTVPTNVHTVPLITSVNGQWTFSLQPIMSVGGVDGTNSPPLLNGLSERASTTLMPLSAAAALAAASGQPPTLAPLPATPIVATATPVTSTTPITPAAPATPATPATPAKPATPATPVTPVTLATGLAQITTKNSTTNDASANPGEPPRLQQRPGLLNPLDSSTPVGNLLPPTTVGPLTAKLNQNAVKLTDFFRTLLEDSLEKVDEPASQLTALRLQLEQIKWRHQQELDEIKHNHDLTLAEMRASFEREKKRAVNEARRAAQADLEAAVKLTKSKQWCANCSQEAQFYCCWNTSYCDYPCQRAHWAQHYAVCAQQRLEDDNTSNNSIGSPSESRLQPQPDLPALQKAAPALTAANAVTRFGPDHATKTSIIMSMVEDTSGNQTMKCVGTYKPSASSSAPAQVSPVIINKQVITSDDSTTTKKVVTSGGYLIVGSSNNSPLVTPARRSHAIQYFT